MSWITDRLNKFNEYVTNNILIRLIRPSDMKLVGHNNVERHLQDSICENEHAIYSPANHVKYAILSHWWLNEGELTYEMMRNGREGDPGYEKLKNFCNQARKYGVEFAWSDTCCIDKSSSTELDESICSMFQWYRNSAICIIHLAQSENISDLLHDEWTSRGWTLQELLAPYKIKFFNKHWVPIASGANDISVEPTYLMMTLEKTTGISHEVLSHKFKPSPSKVDEWMAWAVVLPKFSSVRFSEYLSKPRTFPRFSS